MTIIAVIVVLEVLTCHWWSPPDPGLPAVNAVNSGGK